MPYKKIHQQSSERKNIYPNKLMGQNFLRDKKVLNKIIAAANLTTKDNVLEIGPGLGVLTRELAKRASRVVAVEKDKALAKLLTKQLTEEQISNVEIIEDDILSFLRKQESRPWIPGQARDDKPSLLTNYKKVVANIPYYLTSHLIRLLLESDDPPTDIILMIQKEVAKRICAKPPKMSLLSVSVQFYAEAKIIASVAKNSFWPKPKIDSAIIKITPKIPPPLQRGIKGDLKNAGKILPNPPFLKEGTANFFEVIHSGFSHPRKQLLNNLSAGLAIPRDKIAAILQSADIKPQQRAETLNVEDWIKLTKLFFYQTSDKKP